MITVNLTTTFQRLCLCRISLASLLLQSRLPDKINLWVSSEPYLRDQGIASVDKINQLLESLPEANRGLIAIRWVPNIGPYRKLIPMLRESSAADVIVTADDDIFYGRDWLDGLLQAYGEAGGSPVAARVRMKRVNFFGKKMSYLQWPLIGDSGFLSEDYLITFGAGAVLKREMFREEDIYDEGYLEVAATADDLWYSKLLSRNGNKVFIVPSLRSVLYFVKHTGGLKNDNLPKKSSLISRIRFRIWGKISGLAGFPVCGNDIACSKIDQYFSKNEY